MPYELDEAQDRYEQEQQHIKFLADDMYELGSIYSLEKLVNDWLPDPAQDLVILLAMVNTYRDDHAGLGLHVSNYVRGIYEMIARTQVEMKRGTYEEV